MFTCTVAKAKATRSEIEALAEKLEPALSRAIRDMLKDHVASISLDELAEALKRGDVSDVLRFIGEVDPVKAQAVRVELENAVWAGGTLAVSSPVLSEARFVFNRLNPALIQWLEGYSLNLIREVNRGTTEAVRSVLVEGMRAGRNPIDQARRAKEVVGLTERQARAVASYRKELETFHLKRSAKSWGLGNERSRISGVEVMTRDKKGRAADGIDARRLRDQRYDGALKRAIETRKPIPPEKIDAMVARYQERYIQHRARTIARSESLRATNVGIHEAWRQAIEERKVDGSLVRKRWVLAKDERTCEICTGIFKKQPKRGIPLDAYFENPNGKGPIKAPIAHPNCRCTTFVRLYEPEQLADDIAKAKRDDSNRPNAHQRGYTRQWENARAEYLKTHKKCKCGAAATVVDHVTPHRGNQTKFWDKRNWQALCKTCHDTKTGRGR